jgi:exopolysaccharide biosynthesis polyprenyl glycosylphosphotransferase
MPAPVTLPAAQQAAVRRRRERKLVRFIVLCDIASLVTAGLLAILIAGKTTSAGGPVWLLATVALVLVVFSFYRLYERDRQQIAVSSLDEARDFLNALVLVGFLEMLFQYALDLGARGGGGPRAVVIFCALALALLPLLRAAARHFLVPLLNTPQNTIIIGAGQVGQTMAMKIRKHREYNLRLVGFLDDDPPAIDPSLDDLLVLGGEDDLVSAIRRYRASRIILAFSKWPHDRVLEVIRQAGLREVHLSIVPRYYEIVPANVAVTEVEGIPVLELPAAGLSRLALFTKRGLDLALTLPGLLLLSPLLLAIAIAVKLDSPGPVLFRQPRMGREQRVFQIFKFRTMVVGAEQLRSNLLAANETSGPLFKIRQDPRVTRVGRFLRLLSLDELPQLLNVLKGEMSLVGPRPFVVYEDEKIDGWARRRLELTPGITGLWQVLGRHEMSFEEMVKLDYLYVNNWSLWGDIKLLLRTAPIVFGRRGY